MNISQTAWIVFNQSITDYHIQDNVNAKIQNPYAAEKDLLQHLLYKKNWIDTVQWHLEDIVRDPEINAEKALKIKRWIDESNQERTDMVEYLDSWFLEKYKSVIPNKDAKINTESPAWALDRLSILALKVYHMQEEVTRKDASKEHKTNCQNKLAILLAQKEDLSTAIEELLQDIANGLKYMKIYKQMKMYNDDSLNPILYNKK